MATHDSLSISKSKLVGVIETIVAKLRCLRKLPLPLIIASMFLLAASSAQGHAATHPVARSAMHPVTKTKPINSAQQQKLSKALKVCAKRYKHDRRKQTVCKKQAKKK